ncbi:MAG TPA: hypothetical protein PLU50_10220 [Pseudobdellovibrionaceae bacterium]|nr:hypothetical protein [Pseudobdellovibrionaceae bacterium]
MEKIFYFILGSVLSINIANSTDFKLKRGVGACSNLPQQSDNFVCNAVGWPDHNARVDLIKQEFVEKYGRQVRWGLFDYYYFFHGVKKCEGFKETIVRHLTARKDLDELWTQLGNNSDCVRKGQGWIQTRNLEVWNPDGSPGTDLNALKESIDVPVKQVSQNDAIESHDPMTVKLKPSKTRAAKEIDVPVQAAPKRQPQSESFPKEYF